MLTGSKLQINLRTQFNPVLFSFFHLKNVKSISFKASAKCLIGLEGHIRVSQPSVMTHEDNVKELDGSYKSTQRKVNHTEEQIESKPWMVKELEVWKDLLHRVHVNLQKLTDFNRHFGTLFATSGYKISMRIECALDWALVDVENARRGENRVHTCCPVNV
jgi:hypothetical protein